MMASWWRSPPPSGKLKTFAELLREADGPHTDGRARWIDLRSSACGHLIEPSSAPPDRSAVIYCPGGHAGDVFGEDVLLLMAQLLERQVALFVVEVGAAQHGCDVDSVARAFESLRDSTGIQKLALWGRAAGASAALRYAARENEAAAVICDDADAPYHEALMIDIGQQLGIGSSTSFFRTCAVGEPALSAGFDLVSNVLGGSSGGGDEGAGNGDSTSLSLFEVAPRVLVPSLFMYSPDNSRIAHHLRRECAKNGGQAEIHPLSNKASDCRLAADCERPLLFLVRAFGGNADYAQPVETVQRVPSTIRSLLNDKQQLYRRQGLLKAALNVRPLQGAKIERVLFPEPPPGSLTVPGLDITGTITIQDAKSEVALAWAVETGNGGGCVFFAFISPQVLTFTVVHLRRPSREADDLAHSIEDLRVLGSGPGCSRFPTKFQLKASGTVGLLLTVGDDILDVPAEEAWKQVDIGAGVGLGISSPTLWTALCTSGPQAPRPRIELCTTVNGSQRELRRTPLQPDRSVADRQPGSGSQRSGSSGASRTGRSNFSRSSFSSTGTGVAGVAGSPESVGGDATGTSPSVGRGRPATLLTCSSIVSRTDGSLTMSAWSSQAPSPTSARSIPGTPVLKDRLPQFGVDIESSTVFAGVVGAKGASRHTPPRLSSVPGFDGPCPEIKPSTPRLAEEEMPPASDVPSADLAGALPEWGGDEKVAVVDCGSPSAAIDVGVSFDARNSAQLLPPLLPPPPPVPEQHVASGTSARCPTGEENTTPSRCRPASLDSVCVDNNTCTASVKSSLLPPPLPTRSPTPQELAQEVQPEEEPSVSPSALRAAASAEANDEAEGEADPFEFPWSDCSMSFTQHFGLAPLPADAKVLPWTPLIRCRSWPQMEEQRNRQSCQDHQEDDLPQRMNTWAFVGQLS